jgi:phenylalanine-4-hydroxylase
VQGIVAVDNKIQIITFNACTVTSAQGDILFEPAWGVYDMAVGETITSVFCGAADKDTFEPVILQSSTSTHHAVYDQRTKELHELYQQVRNCRETHGNYQALNTIWQQLKANHPSDWLCALEILELADQQDMQVGLAQEIKQFLAHKAALQPAYKKLIEDGFYLITHPVEQKLEV